MNNNNNKNNNYYNNNNNNNNNYEFHSSRHLASKSEPIISRTNSPLAPEIHGRFVVRQSLSSVINNPKNSSSSSFTVDIPSPPHHIPRIELDSFKKYVLYISKCYASVKEARQLIHQIDEESITNYEPRVSIQKLQEKVPKVYFEENFSLDDPLVFHETCKLDQSPVLEQEKLSLYLDYVEIELVNQLSLRSRDFFNALSRLQFLRDEVTVTCNKIEEMRSRIRSIQLSVENSLQISNYNQKKKNIKEVHKKLSMIATVRQTQPTVQLLLSNSDYIGALELISQTQKILRNDLAGIQSLKHVDFQLSELVGVIEKVMEGEFLRIAVDEVMERSREQEGELEEKLSPLVTGLIHLGKLHGVLSLYSESLNAFIRSVVQDTINFIPPVAEENAPSHLQSLKNPIHEAIKALNSEQFLNIIEHQTFNRVLDQLQRARAVDDYINTLIQCRIDLHRHKNQMNDHPHPHPHDINNDNNNMNGYVDSVTHGAQTLQKLNQNININYCQQVMAESANLLFSACETSHMNCAKLYSIRQEQHTRLSIGDFEYLYRTTLQFIEHSEALCKRQCLGFRGTLISQAKGYFENFHASKSTQMALTLDSEKWTQAQVASEFQEISNKLYLGTAYSPSQKGDEPVSQLLYVKGDGYCVVNSALILLKILSEYLTCATKFPALINDILVGISELLSLFNSRTCQLVLGAGATQLAKLKSITAKNLALASRCLKLVTVFIPKLKVSLEPLFPEKQKRLLNDLDRVLHDYSEHHQEIIEKLVGMMKERVDVSCKNLASSTLWNERSTAASPYILSISKATASLHKILVSILPKDEVQQIFGRIFAMYNASLVEYFSTLRLTPVGKKRLYNDIDCLLNSLTELEGLKEQVLAMMVLRDFFESQFGVINPT